MIPLRFQSGYTLFELLVSMAVFGILSGILVFGFRGAGQANNLRQNAAELVENIRRIQAFSISGSTVKVCTNVSPPIACYDNSVCPGGSSSCDDAASPRGGFAIDAIGVGSTGYKLYANMQDYTINPNKLGYAEGAGNERDMLVALGDVTLSDGAYFTNAGTPVSFMPPRGYPVMTGTTDAKFCMTRPGFENKLYMLVTVKAVSGMIDQKTINGATCP